MTACEEHQGFDEWLQDWFESRNRDPWVLTVEWGEIKAGDTVKVIASPTTDSRDMTSRFLEPRYEKGYELPIVVVNEPLTKRNAVMLRSALALIEKTQGIPFDQGIMMMTQELFLAADWERHKRGKCSLLRGLTPAELDPDLDISVAREKAQAHTLTSVEKLLELWHQTQGNLALAMVKAPNGKLGQPLYSRIPPFWLDLEEMKMMYGEKMEDQNVTVAIPALLAPHLPSILSLLSLREQVVTAFGESPSDVVSLGAPLDQLPKNGNVFRREGQKWVVRFQGGDSRFYDDTIGMSYLHYLLEHPGEPITVGVLSEAMHPPPDPEDNSQPNFEELPKDGTGVVNINKQQSHDNVKLRDEHLKALEELKENVRRAERNDDFTQIAVAKKGVADHVKYLSGIYDKRGRLRTDTDKEKRSRQSISQAIKRAQTVIGEHDPKLAAHFDASLRYEHLAYTYNPRPSVDWAM